MIQDLSGFPVSPWKFHFHSTKMWTVTIFQKLCKVLDVLLIRRIVFRDKEIQRETPTTWRTCCPINIIISLVVLNVFRQTSFKHQPFCPPRHPFFACGEKSNFSKLSQNSDCESVGIKAVCSFECGDLAFTNSYTTSRDRGFGFQGYHFFVLIHCYFVHYYTTYSMYIQMLQDLVKRNHLKFELVWSLVQLSSFWIQCL